MPVSGWTQGAVHSGSPSRTGGLLSCSLYARACPARRVRPQPLRLRLNSCDERCSLTFFLASCRSTRGERKRHRERAVRHGAAGRCLSERKARSLPAQTPMSLVVFALIMGELMWPSQGRKGALGF